MEKLDWNLSDEIQKEGIEQAKKVKNFSVFLQPNNKKYNKNVWENCSTILSEKTNEELLPFLVPLFEWLKDINWPGALNIWMRLKSFDKNCLTLVISYCLMRAKEENDNEWYNNLILFSKEIDL